MVANKQAIAEAVKAKQAYQAAVEKLTDEDKKEMNRQTWRDQRAERRECVNIIRALKSAGKLDQVMGLLK